MAILDDEIKTDTQEDAKAISYIRDHLDASLLPTFTPEFLQGVIDEIVNFLADHWDDEAIREKEGEDYIALSVDAIASEILPTLRQDFPQTNVEQGALADVICLWMDNEGWES